MLRYRLVSAAIVIGCSLAFVALDAWFPVGRVQGFWMVPLGVCLMFGSALECVSMSRQGPIGSIGPPALIGCGGIMAAAAVPLYWPLFGRAYPADCPLGELGWPLAASLVALFGCFAWYLPSYRPNSGILQRSVLAGWVAVYFGGCFAFAVALRQTGSSAWGLYLVVGMIFITKCADAGAYFAGRAFGRRKLCPAVSPGKTVEGLIGGMLVAALAAAVYFRWCAPLVFPPEQVRVSWPGVLALGVLLALTGLLGDLLESIFKREMGCKDSGSKLPGLGGLWDVTDSLLPAFVVGHLIVVADLIHGPGQ